MPTTHTVHLTFSTHWDREWVQTFEQYRFRLVNLVDNLIDILDNEPRLRFVFDGQTIVIEDYLSVRPDREARLRTLATAGRIVFGPWYVLADQFLEGPEATVRNLLIGHRMASRFGGAMKEGYVPDSFGSVAALPSILNGFGIRFANFGRGLAHVPPGEAELFYWTCKDGASVLALARGYNNGVALAYPDIWCDIDSCLPDPEQVGALTRQLVDRETQTLPVNTLSLVVGIDHMEMRPAMTRVVETIEKHLPETAFVVSDPQTCLEAIEAEVHERGLQLKRVAGEMRGDKARPMDLQGVLSTNREMKRRNRECEALVEGHLEPLDVVQRSLTGLDHSHFVDRAWKLVIQNHPHDSICACSLDAVVDDIMSRYDHVRQLHEIMSERVLRNLTPRHYDEAETPSVVLFNTVPGRGRWPFEGLVRIPQGLVEEHWLLEDEEGHVVGRGAVQCDRNMDLETHYATNSGLSQLACKAPDAQRSRDQVYSMLQIRGVMDFGTAAGFARLTLKPAETAEQAAPFGLEAGDGFIRNGRLCLRASQEGRLTMTSESTGWSSSFSSSFEDDADIGDSYDYLPLPGDCPVVGRCAGVSARVMDEYSVELRVTHELEIPSTSSASGRSEATKRCMVDTTYTLAAESGHVAVKTVFENDAMNHRLRLVLRFDSPPDLYSGGHFGALERTWDAEGGQFACRPMMDYLYLAGGSGGLAFLAKGLYEFEPRLSGNAGHLYVTLMRSVDSIGPAAGCNYPVERTKELGRHEASYALAPAKGLPEAANAAAAFRVAVLAEGFMYHTGTTLPGSILCYSTGQVVHSCLKRAADGDGTVVRFYNPTAETVPVTLEYGLPFSGATLTRLDETPVADSSLSVTKNEIAVCAAPWSTVSVKLLD